MIFKQIYHPCFLFLSAQTCPDIGVKPGLLPAIANTALSGSSRPGKDPSLTILLSHLIEQIHIFSDSRPEGKQQSKTASWDASHKRIVDKGIDPSAIHAIIKLALIITLPTQGWSQRSEQVR